MRWRQYVCLPCRGTAFCESHSIPAQEWPLGLLKRDTCTGRAFCSLLVARESAPVCEMGGRGFIELATTLKLAVQPARKRGVACSGVQYVRQPRCEGPDGRSDRQCGESRRPDRDPVLGYRVMV